MSNYSRIRAYFEAHPTPWRLVYQVDREPKPETREALLRHCDEVVYVRHRASREQIVDANGVPVVETWDGEAYASGFEGDVRALVEFVNLVGEEYEPQHGWPGLEGKPYDYGVKRGPLTPEQRQEIKDEYGRRWTDAAEWFNQAGHLLDEEETWQPATNGYEVSTHGRARTPDGTILVPTRSMGGRNVYQLPDGVELIAPARKRDWDKQ